MGILQNYKEGNMDGLRSINYSETGTQPPYVIKDIKDPPNNNDKTIGLQFNKRIDDTARIAQMLVKKPGLKWIGNQALLDNANLQRKAKAAADKKRSQQGGATNAGIALAASSAAAAQVAKVVGSTLAQVPVNGTGTHFVRGFTPDTYLKQGDPNGILGFLGFDGENGASKAKLGKKIIPDGSPQTGLESFPVPDNPTISTTVENDPNQLGLGDISKNTYSEINTSDSDLVTKDSSFDLDKSREKSQNQSSATKIIKVTDYRNSENSTIENPNSYSLDYTDPKIRRETRVGLGNQGDPNTSRSSYTVINSGSIDRINYLDVKTVSNGEDGRIPSLTHTGDEESSRDFIKFNFQVITPDDTTYLYFRAFLTQLDDNYQSSWDATKYLGRAENFYTYQGFERSINIGFNIAAASRAEMKPLYRKMAALASVTTPTYGNDGRFMRGTIAKVTIGDYLYEVPGIIESVNYTWNTNYNWEIAFQNPEGGIDDDMQELPQIMDCSLTFKPIHSFIPEAVGKDRLLPYITNPTANGSNKAIFIKQP